MIKVSVNTLTPESENFPKYPCIKHYANSVVLFIEPCRGIELSSIMDRNYIDSLTEDLSNHTWEEDLYSPLVEGESVVLCND